ncbi:MAG TPA: F0F1 ATP synthase subunit A [Gemmatimonadaceae bacterium]|nr:F0F1 ATP synthase subunit A [Gemmatimonadaceae bacterium]
MRVRALVVALVFALGPWGASAQGTTKAPAKAPTAAPAEAPAQAPAKEPAREDYITPHISDSRHLELPAFSLAEGFTREVELPRWKPLTVFGVELDLSPTKHVVFLLLSATLVALVLIGSARSVQRATAAGRPPSGFANAIEAIVLYIRNEVILPNVGPHGNRFVPFCLTLFWMILSANLLGLVPYGATATGNISVTATLAGLSFLVTEIAGMRTLGKGYLSTIFYWPHDMPLPVRSVMTLIMTPVEIISKFTKPFALAIRLFANMTAGHVVLLALIGMVFTFGSWIIAPLPAAMAVAIMLLELFVAFLQAFIFTMLTSVFIGLIRESHH